MQSWFHALLMMMPICQCSHSHPAHHSVYLANEFAGFHFSAEWFFNFLLLTISSSHSVTHSAWNFIKLLMTICMFSRFVLIVSDFAMHWNGALDVASFILNFQEEKKTFGLVYVGDLFEYILKGNTWSLFMCKWHTVIWKFVKMNAEDDEFNFCLPFYTCGRALCSNQTRKCTVRVCMLASKL